MTLRQTPLGGGWSCPTLDSVMFRARWEVAGSRRGMSASYEEPANG
jgi:hypothetical protein